MDNLQQMAGVDSLVGGTKVPVLTAVFKSVHTFHPSGKQTDKPQYFMIVDI